MKKLMVAVVIAACAAEAFAMPTKQELTKAQPLVAELMAPAMAKYKQAGNKEKAAAAAKVGDASSEFAKAAETEAAKFLLLKGAVNFYTRGEQYDKAADTIAALRREIKDVPPAVIAEITGKATSKISESKAPRLYAVYRTAKLQVRAADEAKTLAAKLKKVKSDALQRKYAEALAVSGDWKAAYAEFAKVGNAKLKEIVAAEAAGKAKSAEAGEFWWAYEPAMEDADDFFKSHAAAYYRKALDAGEITGLKKNLVEQRIAGIAAEAVPSGAVAIAKSHGPVELKTGKNSPFEVNGDTAILTLPNGEKMEFLKYMPGETEIRIGIKNTVDYPKCKKVRISRPYWIMLRPLKKRMYNGYAEISGVWGNDNDYTEGNWKNVMSLCSSIMPNIQTSLPAGYVLRLPSLAEWEFAVHSHKLKDLADEKILDNVDDSNAIFVERSKWKESGTNLIALKESSADKTDPLFWSEATGAMGLLRCLRDENCIVAENGWKYSRLVIGPDLVSEWKAKHGESGAAATTSSSSAPSSGKAWQEKDNTAWLTLPNGEKLEFAKCPAGKAPILRQWGGTPAYFQATVTRPFWIQKIPLQAKDTKGLSGALDLQGRDNWEIQRENIDVFCETLTDEIKSQLPKDYIIRLPSFVELQYAYTEGGKAKTPPYDSVTKYGYGDKLYDEIGIQAQSRANGWGLSHWANLNKILDCMTDENCVFDDKRHARSLTKPSDQNDPLWWGCVPNDADELHDGQTLVSIRVQARPEAQRKVWGVSRLVIGPDLVSEWKAKHGKK